MHAHEKPGTTCVAWVYTWTTYVNMRSYKCIEKCIESTTECCVHTSTCNHTYKPHMHFVYKHGLNCKHSTYCKCAQMAKINNHIRENVKNSMNNGITLCVNTTYTRPIVIQDVHEYICLKNGFTSTTGNVYRCHGKHTKMTAHNIT